MKSLQQVVKMYFNKLTFSKLKVIQQNYVSGLCSLSTDILKVT